MNPEGTTNIVIKHVVTRRIQTLRGGNQKRKKKKKLGTPAPHDRARPPRN